MKIPQLMKEAAAELDARAATIDSLNQKVAALTAEVSQAKAQAKTASAKDEVRIASAAKLAASKMLEVGLVSSEDMRDRLTAQLINDPISGLDNLAKLASLYTAPKLGSVDTEGTTAADLSAEATYAESVRRVNATRGNR